MIFFFSVVLTNNAVYNEHEFMNKIKFDKYAKTRTKTMIKFTQSSDHEVLRWRRGFGHLAFLCSASLGAYCQVSGEKEREILAHFL